MFKKYNLLEKIAVNEGTDKSKNKHGYTKWYNFYFDSIRQDKLNILEIGVDKGYSLLTWRKYFNNAMIYGIDNREDDICEKAKEVCDIFIGDGTDRVFLKKICKKVPDGFDIIIDDGSHRSKDQIKSFEYLFGKLNPGGIYVIEDLYLSYNKYFQTQYFPTIIEYLKKRVDDVNFSGKYKWCDYDIIRKKEKAQELVRNRRTKKSKIKVLTNKYERTIEAIHFYNGICFILKRG